MVGCVADVVVLVIVVIVVVVVVGIYAVEQSLRYFCFVLRLD